MPKGSPELTEARREEIINACESLYQTMSFKEVTIKEISSLIFLPYCATMEVAGVRLPARLWRLG